jgi:hypothetical protein
MEHPFMIHSPKQITGPDFTLKGWENANYLMPRREEPEILSESH